MLAIDITEFLRNPIRTGIQRVVREILAHWPEHIAKEIVFFDEATGFKRVAPEIVEFCIDLRANPYITAVEASRIVAEGIARSAAPHVDLVHGDRLLIPELFNSLSRVTFHKHLHSVGVELYPVVYDLMAWTSPDALNIPYVGGLNDYLSLLFLAKERAFISRSVRDVFCERFVRGPSDGNSVMPLGSDSLQRQNGNRPEKNPYLVCVGALDGRKGQDLVFEAFLSSPASRTLNLVFAGKVPKSPRRELLPLLTSKDPRVQIIDDPDDRELASLIQDAQASIFISRYEGFGLPAVESLYLGTPVIVAEDLPAVSNLDKYGQIRLRSEEAAELVAAISLLSQPDEALKLKAEISQLKLQTWSSYTNSIAVWASS